MTTITIGYNRREQRLDPNESFQTAYEKRLLRLFKAGATLNLWRWSKPYHWYVLHRRGPGLELSLRGEETPAPGIRDVQAVVAGLQRLGKKISLPTSAAEVWMVDDKLAHRRELEWAEVQAAYQQRLVCPRRFTPDLTRLSSLALALLRSLRNQSFYPFRALLEPLRELDQQGLLRMDSTGHFHLCAAAATLRVPRGPGLTLRAAGDLLAKTRPPA